MTAESARSRRWYFVVVPVVGIAAGVFAAEALARAFHLAPPVAREYGGNVPDPFLPFRRRPLSVLRGTAATGEFTYEYRHNSAGFRDWEHSPGADEDVIRILGLGDSFTYGSWRAL